MGGRGEAVPRILRAGGGVVTEPCAACGLDMDPVLPSLGCGTHPCCDPGAEGAGDDAVRLILSELGGTVIEPSRPYGAAGLTGGYETQVRAYLADCEQASVKLDPRYHPAADGAAKMIPHGGVPAVAKKIREAFQAVAK
jgi:hypothetical protein